MQSGASGVPHNPNDMSVNPEPHRVSLSDRAHRFTSAVAAENEAQAYAINRGSSMRTSRSFIDGSEQYNYSLRASHISAGQNGIQN